MVAKSTDMINFANKLIPLVKDEKEAHDMYMVLAREARNLHLPFTTSLIFDIARQEMRHGEELERAIQGLQAEARKLMGFYPKPSLPPE